MEVGGHRHAPVTLFPGKRPGTLRIGGQMRSTAGRDNLQNRKIPLPPGIEPQFRACPVCRLVTIPDYAINDEIPQSCTAGIPDPERGGKIFLRNIG